MATEIRAAVPSGFTAGDHYTVQVKNLQGHGEAPGTFLVTSGTGACAPTVTSFAPTCGSTGDVVVITGTNLLKDVGGTDEILGGDVYFNPYDTDRLANHVSPDVDDATSLNRIVPSGSGDGPLKVDTGVGSPIFTTANFEVPSPDCPVTGPTTHARSITLSLKKHLVAKGVVSVGDGFTEGAASVPVKIQRRVSGHWKTVGAPPPVTAVPTRRRSRTRPASTGPRPRRFRWARLLPTFAWARPHAS